MKSTIIEKAKKIVKNRRFEAENQALSNKEKAFEDECFKRLYLEYVNKMIENARLNNNDENEISELKNKIQERIKDLKIGSIEPQYYCKNCNDIGFTSEGKYCKCLIDELNKILIKESGFLELEDFKDSNYKLFSDDSEMMKLYIIMQKWCHSNFDKNIIFLAGETGVGKTHLTRCMANELIKRHKLVLFTSSFAMHQDFVKSHATKDALEKQELISKYIDAEILFIDDLGTELKNQNITINYLHQVLNERKLNKQPTIITSNLNLEEIKDYYDERISSRLVDTKTSISVFIKGDDLRLKSKIMNQKK